MNILLDTHILLWHLLDDSRLSKIQSEMIENSENSKFFSIASLWEIAIKSSIGKLNLTQSIDKIVPQSITILDLKLSHIQRVEVLPFHHKDPFDRIIISQAIEEDLVLMSDDGNFKFYNVKTL